MVPCEEDKVQFFVTRFLILLKSTFKRNESFKMNPGSEDHLEYVHVQTWGTTVGRVDIEVRISHYCTIIASSPHSLTSWS